MSGENPVDTPPIKPGPRVNKINQPFWDACNRGEMRLQQCDASGCGKWTYFPRISCPYCGGGALSWKTASGLGTIVTYTRIHRPHHKAFLSEAPYYFIAVQLDEGPLMYSRLEHAGTATELAGERVKAFFVEQSPGQKLPFFRVASPAAQLPESPP